jgi:hypothetical protein
MIPMRNIRTLLVIAALAASTVSCGDVVRDGKSPVFLVIQSLGAARGGASSSDFGGTLHSDVLTLVTSPAPCTAEAPCPTIFSDSGQAIFRISPKDIGPAAAPTAPSANNEVTITRYRVTYRRADGRNTPGIDVPYPFDGAVTGTVPATGTLTLGFEIVRHVAKMESPLVQLITNPMMIATIAEISFYGRDQVGNEISATGSILIQFGNFGDES